MTSKPDYMTPSFEYADARISAMLRKAEAKGLCQCCTAKALLFNSVALSLNAMGSVETVALLASVLARAREQNIPAPEQPSQH
jgi:hypothetical protein